MKVSRLLFVPLVVLWLAFPSQSHASTGFGIELSAGGNYSFLVNQPRASERIGLNAEMLFSFQLLLISFDLGVQYDFFKRRMYLRPGARIWLGWFYIRAAVPLAFPLPSNPYDAFNLGALVGAGLRFKLGRNKQYGIFIEGNVTPFFIDINDRGVLLPAELRVGVGYYF